MNAHLSKKFLLILSLAMSPALLAEASTKSFKVVNNNKPSEKTPIYVYLNGQEQFRLAPGQTRSVVITPGEDRLSYGLIKAQGQVDMYLVNDDFITSHGQLNYPTDHNTASERQVKKTQAIARQEAKLDPVQINQALTLQ